MVHSTIARGKQQGFDFLQLASNVPHQTIGQILTTDMVVFGELFDPC